MDIGSILKGFIDWRIGWFLGLIPIIVIVVSLLLLVAIVNVSLMCYRLWHRFL